MKVVLRMFFLALSNVDVEFAGLGKLIWRSYTIAEILLTISKIELIDKKKFAKVTLDKNLETFVIYVVILAAEMLIHLYK